MSKIIVFFIILVSLAIFGLYQYRNKTNVDSIPDSPSPLASANIKSDLKRYAPYSKEILESSKPFRRVLFFYASWCPTCRPADADFVKNELQIPEDVRLIRVNYNDPDTDKDERDLAVKYNVTYQHTFIQIDDSGNVVTKWNGGNITELLKNLK